MTKLRTLGLIVSPATRIGNECFAMTLSRAKTACAALLLCAATATVTSGQSFRTLASFDGTDGSGPRGLVEATDGNFYGTTVEEGAGTVFEITPAGKLTTLYSFCPEPPTCPDGDDPYGSLIQATNRNFYGTTALGGTGCAERGGCGSVFEITPAGKLTTLYSFCSQVDCTDGASPWAGLRQATDGNFYGTTGGGGAYRSGTVYEVTQTGKLKTLYSFCAQVDCTDGEDPLSELVQATDGNFYGTTYKGGAYGLGTVFQITPAGELTTLHSFEGTDGANPWAGLTQATNGDFYGTTSYGGASYGEAKCAPSGCGTVFEITPAGELTTLYNFCPQVNCTDGSYPYAGLVLATDGNFYGTTSSGTAFEITPVGTLTTLHFFYGGDGIGPGALIQATNGGFYGTTSGGGAHHEGTVFGLSVGLAPFVETNPTSGKVGAKVIIFGNNLTGTTGVAFNGTAAVYAVVSSTEIKATVPSGATTGNVQVTTPSATLTSNLPFDIMQ